MLSGIEKCRFWACGYPFQINSSVLYYMYKGGKVGSAMIQDFYDNHIFLYIMGGLCGFGVFLKCFLLVIYNKLIKASECMTITKKNWLKNMRLRFESSYQLQLGVNDVDTYVDKYVSKIKYGGLLLSTWENLSGQTIGLCLLTGSFAGILGFVYECGQGPVLFTFFSGAWTAIIVNIVDNVVNISAHKQMLRYNLIDYFENNLKVRMEQELYHSDARRKYQRQYFDEPAERNTGNLIEVKPEDALEEETPKTKIIQVKEEPLHHITSKKEERAARKQEKLQAKVADQKARKEAKEAKKQAILDAKAAKKQAKLDAKAAKKQGKFDAVAARKKEKEDARQARLDAIQANKQAKLDNKQQRIDEKKAKKKAKEDAKIAKEKAIIEDMLAKKKAKEAERDEKNKNRQLALQERERIEKENRQKELENNKAYKEKMRLKQEKEREAAKRKVELQLIEKAKEQERKQKEEVALTVKVDEDKVDMEAEANEFEHMEEADSFAMTATSKEEDALIEEVLKDFLF